MLELSYRWFCLKTVFRETGYVLNGRVFLALFRYFLRLYDKDGVVKDELVQAGYGRKDLTKEITQLENDIAWGKSQMKAYLDLLFSR